MFCKGGTGIYHLKKITGTEERAFGGKKRETKLFCLPTGEMFEES